MLFCNLQATLATKFGSSIPQVLSINIPINASYQAKSVIFQSLDNTEAQ